MAEPPAGEDPRLETIRAWVAVGRADDEQLVEAFEAELEDQELRCTWPGRRADPPSPRPKALDQALKRRVARALAARGVTLGIVSTDGDLGATRLPRWDAEIERYEAPYRVLVLG